ncbi:MAG: amino acid deaminase/aldolase, partial [archaeon]|nr:amino acid deaminase/aldolase [archaeon]
SLFMALRIVRNPQNNIATAFSGGYYSSGSGLGPKIELPNDCIITKREGFGEVQTPIIFKPNKVQIKHGDLIICRLAKAGEPMERFNEVIAISKGEIIEKYPTYRGVGLWLG